MKWTNPFEWPRRYIEYRNGRFVSTFHTQSSYPRLYVSKDEPIPSSPYAKSVSTHYQTLSAEQKRWFPKRVALVQSSIESEPVQFDEAQPKTQTTWAQTYIREDWYEKLVFGWGILLMIGWFCIFSWFNHQLSQLPPSQFTLTKWSSGIQSLHSTEEQLTSQALLESGQQRLELLSITQAQEGISVQYEALKQSFWQSSSALSAGSLGDIQLQLTLLEKSLLTDSSESYQTWKSLTTVRIQAFYQLLNQLSLLPSLEAQVLHFNDYLEQDTAKQSQQIEALKIYLMANQLDFDEQEGQIRFNLP